MAYEAYQKILPGLTAGTGLTVATARYKFVKRSTGTTVVLCDGTGDKPIGVLQAPVLAAGDAVIVCYQGITKVQGDDLLTVDASIGTSADGQAAAYTATDTTKYIVGRVLEANGAAGDYATAVIDCVNIRTLA